MPVGPHILWPEKARKSQPRSWTSRGVAGALGGIDQGGDAEFAGAGAQFGDGVDDAEGIRDVGQGEELDLSGEEFVEAAKVEQPNVPGDRQEGEPSAGALGQQLPGDDVAVVLHLGEQEDVAGAQVLGAPGLARPD